MASKMTNEKLRNNIESINAKIGRITAGKARAQGQLDRADQDIAEAVAQRSGYIALLAARGEVYEEPADGAEDEAPADPEFGEDGE